MALKGLDIFKLTPKTNCKDCGCPTCMAFSMKVAQGAIAIDKCPHFSEEALKVLGEASEPPMKTITVGSGVFEHKLGGETVLYRHEKTFVSKTLYGINLYPDTAAAVLEAVKKIDYERIGERMYIEAVNVKFSGDKQNFLDTVKIVIDAGRILIIDLKDSAADYAASAEAKQTLYAALEISKDSKPILNAANENNYQSMSELAQKYGALLGVKAKTTESLRNTVTALEALGNKNLVIDVGCPSIKDTFARAVQIRRAALQDQDRSFGYPSLVNLAKLAPGDSYMQSALASLFTLKYGSIVIMDNVSYGQMLPLFGLRQNIFTDPQKPMKVEPGIYPINGADENSVCAITVDFALTYFMVSGEFERSGIPVNLLIGDAGGYSVLTAWAAGKFSAGSIAKFIKENDIEGKIKNRNLIIPGKVAVLKGSLEENLPGWKIIIAPNEASGLVKFMKELKI